MGEFDEPKSNFEKRLREYFGDSYWEDASCRRQVEGLMEIIEELKKDLESNATFASKELMVIDRKKWLKWLGK